MYRQDFPFYAQFLKTAVSWIFRLSISPRMIWVIVNVFDAKDSLQSMPSTLYRPGLYQICFLLTHRRLLCFQDRLHAKFAQACLQYRSVQEQYLSFESQSYLVISKWTHFEPRRLQHKSFQELDGQYLGFSASVDWTSEMNLSMGGLNSLV